MNNKRVDNRGPLHKVVDNIQQMISMDMITLIVLIAKLSKKKNAISKNALAMGKDIYFQLKVIQIVLAIKFQDI